MPNFQEYQPSGSEDFKVFTLYGRGSHLGHVTWNVYRLSQDKMQFF